MPLLLNVACASLRAGALYEPEASAWSDHRLASGFVEPTARKEADATLHDAFTQNVVFAGEQILGELITPPVNVAAGTGKVMVDP